MDCPQCRAPYQPGDRFCGSCGQHLEGLAAPTSAPPAPAVNPWAVPSIAVGKGMPDPGAATVAVPPGALGVPGYDAPPSDPFGAPPGFDPMSRDRFGAPSPPAGPIGTPPQGGPFAAPSPAPGIPPAHPQHAPGLSCPSCGAPVEATDTICLVCGLSLKAGAAGPMGGSPSGAISPFGGPAAATPPPQSAPPPAAQAAPSMAAQGDGGALVAMCPIHGEMDRTWTRCPDCIREGRDGRVVMGPSAAPAAPPVSGAAPAPPFVMPPSIPGAQPVNADAYPPAQYAPVPQTPAQGVWQTAPPPPPGMPAAGATPLSAPTPVAASMPGAETPEVGERPASSVGQTFVIRRRPRTLAYLIEKEGQQVGRVYQIDKDITDIGRDPRNTIVLTDGAVSGFHARLERGPDGSFLISDRGSSNGSRFNGEPLTVPRTMDENDEFGLGSTLLVLKLVQ